LRPAEISCQGIAGFNVTSSFARQSNFSEVLSLSDTSAFKNLTFYNVYARQGSSFCYKGRLNFQVNALLSFRSKEEYRSNIFANIAVQALEKL